MTGEPLLLDVASTVQRAKLPIDAVVGGRFGLGSKDFTPGMAVAVFDNMSLDKPAAEVKDSFVVGIVDDVGFAHLTPAPEIDDAVPPSTTECLFWCGLAAAAALLMRLMLPCCCAGLGVGGLQRTVGFFPRRPRNSTLEHTHSLSPTPSTTTNRAPNQNRGMGSDGTVGANKEAVKIIAGQDGMHAQV